MPSTSLEERAREWLHKFGSDPHYPGALAGLLIQVQAEARLSGMITQLKAVCGYLPQEEYDDRLSDLERELAQAAAPRSVGLCGSDSARNNQKDVTAQSAGRKRESEKWQ